MIKFFGLLLFVCTAGIVLGADREIGHPIFRTFTAHDYGGLGETNAVTEDSQGRMLFGRPNEIAAFDKEVTKRLPRRVAGDTTYSSAHDLTQAITRAAKAHKQYEARTGQADPNWPDWYAEARKAESSAEPNPAVDH